MDPREQFAYTLTNGTYTSEGFIPHLEITIPVHGKISLPVALSFNDKRSVQEVKNFPTPMKARVLVDGIPTTKYVYMNIDGTPIS